MTSASRNVWRDSAATAMGSEACNQQHMLLVIRITNPGSLNVPLKIRLSRVESVRILE
jgi:hypothetical protein